jgi:hypothetical protein
MTSTNDDEPAATGGGQTPVEAEQAAHTNPERPGSRQRFAEAGEAAGLVGAAASTGGIAAATTAACLTSGCIIASMTAAGAAVGASAAAGPMLIAGAPAYLSTKAINRFAFQARDDFDPLETERRAAARRATGIGALLGVAGTGVISLSGGLSTAAVVQRLRSVGALVGGGSMTGAVLLALLPAATAGAFGVAGYAMASTKRSRLRALRAQSVIGIGAPA